MNVDDEINDLLRRGEINESQVKKARILIRTRNRWENAKKKMKSSAYKPYQIHKQIKVDKNQHGHYKRQNVPNLDYIKTRGSFSQKATGVDKLKMTIFGDKVKSYFYSGQYGSDFALKIKGLGQVFAKHGNNKPIPSWIMILNTSAAIDCATRHCGGKDGHPGCEFFADCYALGNEAQSMRQYAMVAGLGLTANSKRKKSAMVRKMIHETDPWAFANGVLNWNGKKNPATNLNVTRFIRWNEAGDVKDGTELLWIGKAAGYLGLGIVMNDDGTIKEQKYWQGKHKPKESDENIESIASTIYTHRTDVYKAYLEELEKWKKKIEEEEDLEQRAILLQVYDSIQENFTIMGSSFMASNEFRAVRDEFTTADNIDEKNRVGDRYRILDGDVYSTSRNADGDVIMGDDEDIANGLVNERGEKLFPVYHCSSNCELCQEQYGIALCYAKDLRGAIVEEKMRFNNDSIRNMVRDDGMMDANNPNNYMDHFTVIRDELATPQKKDIMFDVLGGQEVDGNLIESKKDDLPDSVYFDWNTGKYRDDIFNQYAQEYADSFDNYNIADIARDLYQKNYVEPRKKEAEGGRLTKAERDKKWTDRDVAYIQHYFNFAYGDRIMFAHDRPLTQDEWDTTYPNGIDIDPQSWGK